MGRLAAGIFASARLLATGYFLGAAWVRDWRWRSAARRRRQRPMNATRVDPSGRAATADRHAVTNPHRRRENNRSRVGEQSEDARSQPPQCRLRLDNGCGGGKNGNGSNPSFAVTNLPSSQNSCDTNSTEKAVETLETLNERWQRPPRQEQRPCSQQRRGCWCRPNRFRSYPARTR